MIVSIRKKLAGIIDRISYILTAFIIGAAGIVLAMDENLPHKEWIAGLTLGFLVLALVGITTRVAKKTGAVMVILLVQSGIIFALVRIAPSLNFFVIWFYIMAVYTVLTLPPKAAYTWIVFFTLVTLALMVSTYGWVGGITSAGIYASGFVFFIIFANMTKRANEARQESERLLDELREAHHALQVYAAKAETLAVSEERNRLAREMHDTLGHRLTVSAVQLEAAQRLIPENPARAAQMVETVRRQVRAALTELRQTVAALRQPLESDLPLAYSLPRLIADFEEATGLRIDAELPAPFPALTPQQQLTIYRAVQEGLTNVHKHASASHVQVQVVAGQKSIVLHIQDDGSGLAAAFSGGFGLRGLGERAARLGGTVQLLPRPEGGAVLTMSLPLDLDRKDSQ